MHRATLHGVGVITKPYFAILAAFKESMTLNLAQKPFKVIHIVGNRKPVYDFTVWAKNPLGFSCIFSQTVENFYNLYTYYTFPTTLDCKLLSNYLQFWQSYAILKATTQFTPYVQNVHKQLGIFGPNFTDILHYKFWSNYLQLWRSYAILSATTQHAFQPMVDILSI